MWPRPFLVPLLSLVLSLSISLFISLPPFSPPAPVIHRKSGVASTLHLFRSPPSVRAPFRFRRCFTYRTSAQDQEISLIASLYLPFAFKVVFPFLHPSCLFLRLFFRFLFFVRVRVRFPRRTRRTGFGVVGFPPLLPSFSLSFLTSVRTHTHNNNNKQDGRSSPLQGPLLERPTRETYQKPLNEPFVGDEETNKQKNDKAVLSIS